MYKSPEQPVLKTFLKIRFPNQNTRSGMIAEDGYRGYKGDLIQSAESYY